MTARTPESWERVGLTVQRVIERRMKVLTCVCGGRIRADRVFPAEGVRSHQRTKQHQAWRAARDAE